LPRKYSPERKLKTSPSGAPSLLRKRCASEKLALGARIIRARRPEQLAGDNKKIRLATDGI
jgi:hypothetical protein